MTDYVENTPDYPGLFSLAGKHVVVLGGGLGMGRQTCIGASKLGARVSVVDIDPERAAAVASTVGGLAITGDATDRADMERLFAEAVARQGPVHGIADIVGGSTFRPIKDLDEAVILGDLDLNLRHVLLALQIGSRAMTEGGSIVFVSSISGIRSAPNHAVYGAAKAAVVNLVGSASVELGPAIRVNSVAPGQVATPRVVERHPEPGYFDEVGAKVPLGRVGEPRDIASALLFFLSDLSQWVTGQTLVVDGGSGRRFQYSL
jgi:NAD(P)-dependent dehydrogenase (short-subunit alcohol dehydrogenase family)